MYIYIYGVCVYIYMVYIVSVYGVCVYIYVYGVCVYICTPHSSVNRHLGCCYLGYCE